MSNAVTTPFPLLEETDLTTTPNRIGSHCRPEGKVRYMSAPELVQWEENRWPSVCVNANINMQEIYAYVAALIVRMRQAQCNDELTRPVAFPDPGGYHPLNANRLLWLEMKKNREFAQHCAWEALLTTPPVVAAADTVEERPQPEFVWDETIFNALKAVEEFSKETDANY